MITDRPPHRRVIGGIEDGATDSVHHPAKACLGARGLPGRSTWYGSGLFIVRCFEFHRSGELGGSVALSALRGSLLLRVVQVTLLLVGVIGLVVTERHLGLLIDLVPSQWRIGCLIA